MRFKIAGFAEQELQNIYRNITITVDRETLQVLTYDSDALVRTAECKSISNKQLAEIVDKRNYEATKKQKF